MNTSPLAPSQDRIIAALSCFVFFIPHLMGRRTEYILFYAKQGLLIGLALFIASLLPFIGGMIGFLAFAHGAFLAWQAYSGTKFSIPYLTPASDRLISILGIGSLFVPQ